MSHSKKVGLKYGSKTVHKDKAREEVNQAPGTFCSKSVNCKKNIYIYSLI